MKRTITSIVVLLLACGVGATVARHLVQRQYPQNVPAKPPSEPFAKETNSVNYKGVSFTFDRSLAPEINAETLPQVTDGKPCDIVPEHPAFVLVGYPRPSSMPDEDPHIRVFSLKKFREAVAIASEENRKTVVYPKNPPNWTTYFDEEVRVLRALLEKQPKSPALRTFLAKVRSREARRFNDFPQMPFLPMWEASQSFFARPQYLRFKNGQGVFFLTAWDAAETNEITNDALEYAYQGITDDGKYGVYAEFSVKVPFLPRENDQDVIAWREKNWRLAHNSEQYRTYLRPIVEKLEALPANQFQPNLELLERLIQSLEVRIQD